MRFSKLRGSQWTPIALIIAVCALAYLPGLVQATIYRDNWYYVLDRLMGGSGVFPAMFSIDRPARGPFFELYYQLFGITPLPYHLASFAWRLGSGLAALWLFRLLWPGQRRAAMWMAVLLVLFPGYLRWMEGFEDQPQIASLCLENLSIALTIEAITTKRKAVRVVAWLGSLLAGWAYLALVDFGMGMEVFRLLCVFIVIEQSSQGESLWRRVLAAFRAWLPAALVPAGFLAWRLFFFHNQRPQTDVGRQLGVLLASPLSTAAAWLIRLFQSVADVAVFSWVTPALQGFFGLRIREFLPGVLVVVLAVACVYFVACLWDSGDHASGMRSRKGWQAQAIAIGITGVIAGVAPVIAANRYVDFQRYSHYALPASLAAAVFLVGAAASLGSHRALSLIGSGLVACAVMTHYAYSMQVLDEERTIAAFWFQVAWRAPALAPGTTLFVNYPGIDYAEKVDAAQAPANLIYYPESTDRIPVTYPLVALPRLEQSVVDVLVGKDSTVRYRTHQGAINFDRLLVLSQPTSNSCVHLLNGQEPFFSAADPSQVRVTGAYSHIEQVTSSGRSPVLPSLIFGPEPPHGWCYYFERADLALQNSDWQRIDALGRQAAAAGLHADDATEWMPFLEAYAHLGDTARFTGTAHRLSADSFARRQACTALRQGGNSFSAAVESQIDALLCGGK